MESTNSSLADSLENDVISVDDGIEQQQQDMTEDEVNKMVQEALQRARRAMMSRTSRIGEDNPTSAPGGSSIVLDTSVDNITNDDNNILDITSSSLEDDDRMIIDDVKGGYDTNDTGNSVLSAKLEAIRNTISHDSIGNHDDVDIDIKYDHDHDIESSFDMTNNDDNIIDNDDDDSKSEDNGKVSSKLTNYKGSTTTAALINNNNYSLEKTKEMSNTINDLYKEVITSSEDDNESSKLEESEDGNDDSIDTDYQSANENIENPLIANTDDTMVTDVDISHQLSEEEDDDHDVTQKLNDLKIRNDYIKLNNPTTTNSDIIQIAEKEANEALFLASKYKSEKDDTNNDTNEENTSSSPI